MKSGSYAHEGLPEPSLLQELRAKLVARAEAVGRVLATRAIMEACPEHSLPLARRLGRVLLRVLRCTPSPATRKRNATQTELASAAQELDRVHRAAEKLAGAVSWLSCLPTPADPSRLRLGEGGYPDDWPDISLAYRRRVHSICESCGTSAPDGHVHHILPVSRGGGSEDANLIFLCRSCHAREHPHMRED